MLESFKASLATWNSKNNERVKLQHAYIVLAVVLLLTAGLIGLLNREVGQNILVAAITSAALFLANAVVWSLMQSAVLMRLKNPRTNAARKK